MKRVLLFVVDGCTSRLVEPALARGELPTLAALAERGTLDLGCTSIFPSITPAATASIVTGRYPAEHGITGMSWWNPSTGDISYFGDDVWTVLKRGAGDFLRGFLLRLNGERLQSPTIFEIAERQGRRAACFNHLIFRGDVAHEVSQPLLLSLLPSVGSTLTVQGPSWLCLGDLIAETARHDVDAEGGVLNRFGMDDAGTESFLRDLPSAEALPDVSVAYFADYDFDSHDRGPQKALETLRRFDRRLSAILEDWGGLDRVLESACIMLTADHSHSDIDAGDRAEIVLDEVLRDYRLADPGSGWRDEDELLICPNMRAAEIYLRTEGPETVHGVSQALLQERRVDQVIWREDGDGDWFVVATRDRGTLRFRRGGPGDSAVRDEYGATWTLEGDHRALALEVADGAVSSPEYPNALERIANGVDRPRRGRLWVTARIGCEFQAPGQDVHHDAGSHGSLHAHDSVVPLLISGAPGAARPPARSRIVDAVPWACRVLGLECPLQPGERRA